MTNEEKNKVKANRTMAAEVKLTSRKSFKVGGQARKEIALGLGINHRCSEITKKHFDSD
jgi:hypothetical protein